VDVASDLHFDLAGRLTSPATVAALVEQIRATEPAAVVLAGDLGHPLENFRRCLAAFRSLPVPVAVLAGNHDVWRDEVGLGSRELWEHGLADATREAGALWLEDGELRIDDVAIVGSLTWYYLTQRSAKEERVLRLPVGGPFAEEVRARAIPWSS